MAVQKVTLRKKTNSLRSTSWRCEWKAPAEDGYKTVTITLGPTSKVDETTARSYNEHIQELLYARDYTGGHIKPEQDAWLKNIISTKLFESLVKHSLAPRPEYLRSPEDFHLRNVLKRFESTKAGKHVHGTRVSMEKIFLNLIKFFGDTRNVKTIQKSDAQSFREWLIEHGRTVGTQPLLPSTVNKRIQKIRGIFSWIVKVGLLTVNPFEDVEAANTVNQDKFHFVTDEEAHCFVDCQPTMQDKALVLLARYGGLRVPGDVVAMQNKHVDLGDGTARNPGAIEIFAWKKRRHPERAWRHCPIFPELREVLTQLCEREPDPEGYLFKGEKWDRVRSGELDISRLTLSTRFKKRYETASGKPCWPQVFVNMRSTRFTELTKRDQWDEHTVSKWLGNSVRIQRLHYQQLRPGDFAKAAGIHPEAESVKGGPQDGKQVEEKVEYPTTLPGLLRFDGAIERVFLELRGSARRVPQTSEKQGFTASSQVAALAATSASGRRSPNSESSGGGTRTPDTRIMIPML